MSRIKDILKICLYEFRIQMSSKRVWLGYMVGIVIIMKQAFGYLQYAGSTGEPINVLETFVVCGNNANTVMFLVLGWLFVISEAPFVNNNSLYLIHRTSKKNWNAAMILYIILQAVIYYSIVAVFTIFFSVQRGFFANIWSSPLVELTKSIDRGIAFNVGFTYEAFIKEVSVFQAFFYTWLLGMVYGVILGLCLHTFNLFARRAVGVAVTFLVHFLGYEIMQEGFMMLIKASLLGRSIPVLQIGGVSDVTLPGTLLIYLASIVALCSASGKIVKYMDFKEASKGEVE